MKALLLTLLLPLLTHGSVIAHERRQLPGGGLLSAYLPKLKAYKIEELPSQLNVTSGKRVRITFGPYKLKGTKTNKRLGNGFSMDSGGTSYANDVDTDFPRDITILQASTEVHNKDGKLLELKDGFYNHHTVFLDITKLRQSPYTCAASKWGFGLSTLPIFAGGAMEKVVQVFMASSPEVKSGLYLSNTGPLVNLIDAVNYNEQDMEVFTSTEFEYLPGKPSGYRDVYITLVDPGLCGGQNGAFIQPPKGVSKFSVNGTDIVMNQSGYFVHTQGHVHDGGINIVLKVNDKEVCNSRALYGGPGHTITVNGRTWETIRQTTPCTGTIRVEKGDRIYMQANYDLELHPSREMGGSHGKGHGMKFVASEQAMKAKLDSGAEQMAQFAAYFSPDS